jgi:hypothetical protein
LDGWRARFAICHIHLSHAELSEDNPAMEKHRELLPWILGGLMIATVALAIAVGSTNRIAPRNLQTLGQPGSETLPATLPAIAPTPTPTPTPTPVPTPPPPVAVASIQAMTPTPSTEPSVKIWECTINGIRTFSNKSCGDKPSIREIGPVNTMESTPIFRFDPAYGPESSYQPDYPDSSPQESPDNSYPTVIGIPFHQGRRTDHAHQPHGRNHGPSPRKN